MLCSAVYNQSVHAKLDWFTRSEGEKVSAHVAD